MPYMKKKPQASKTVKAAARSEVKKALNKTIETKNFYCRQNPLLNPQYTGIVINLLQDAATVTSLSQGTGRNNFIGDTIDPVYISCKYLCQALIPANSFYTYRIILLQVIGGNIPTATNVLSSVGNVMTPYSPYDPTYRSTFRVLYDRMHIINEKSENAVSGTIKVPSSKLRKVEFVGTSAASISKNGIYMYVYTDSATVNPIFGFQSVVAFKDA